MRRSTRAETMVLFSNSSVHRENGRFVVTIVLERSLRSEMTLKSSSDSYLLKLIPPDIADQVFHEPLLVAGSRITENGLKSIMR